MMSSQVPIRMLSCIEPRQRQTRRITHRAGERGWDAHTERAWRQEERRTAQFRLEPKTKCKLCKGPAFYTDWAAASDHSRLPRYWHVSCTACVAEPECKQSFYTLGDYWHEGCIEAKVFTLCRKHFTRNQMYWWIIYYPSPSACRILCTQYSEDKGQMDSVTLTLMGSPMRCPFTGTGWVWQVAVDHLSFPCSLLKSYIPLLRSLCAPVSCAWWRSDDALMSEGWFVHKLTLSSWTHHVDLLQNIYSCLSPVKT